MNSIFHKMFIAWSVPQTHLKPNGQYFKEKNPKFISKLGITINNFEELCENYPFLNLNSESSRKQVNFDGIDLSCSHLPKFIHITTTSFDDDNPSCSYLSDYIVPYI